jgi:hypothetical protein
MRGRTQGLPEHPHAGSLNRSSVLSAVTPTCFTRYAEPAAGLASANDVFAPAREGAFGGR